MKKLTKNKKLLAIVIALIVGVLGGGAYMTVLKPKASGPPPLNVYGIGDSFYFNLTDAGHYAKGIVVIETTSVLPTQAPNSNATDASGPLWLAAEDYALARSAVTSTVSSYSSSELLTKAGINAMKAALARNIGKALKIKVADVLLTDFIVQ